MPGTRKSVLRVDQVLIAIPVFTFTLSYTLPFLIWPFVGPRHLQEMRSIFDSIDQDGTNQLKYSEFLAAAIEEADFLYCGESYRPGIEQTKYIKMKGRKIYEYALSNVPLGMKETLDKSGKSIYDVKKIFLHQANEKMDGAIVERFYNLYGITDVPKDIMPMSIKHLGNSSVATIPTLIDLVIEKNLDDHEVKKGDVVIIASVGAGMNINAITYQF